MKFYQRIVFKISAFYVALIILSVSLMSVLVLDSLKDSLIKQAYSNNMEIAIASKTILDRKLQGVENEARNIAQYLSLNSQSLEEKLTLLEKTLIETDNQLDYFVLDSTGMKIFTLQSQLGDRSDRDYYLSAMKGLSQFSSVIISRSTGIPITVFATPMYQNGEIDSVLCVVVELEFLNEKVIDQMNQGEREIYIVDSYGMTVAHPNRDFVKDVTLLTHLQPVKRFMDGEIGSIRYEVNQKDIVASFERSDLTGWGIIVEEPVEIAFAELYEIRTTIIVFSLLSTLLTILCMYLYMLGVNRPIKLLEGQMNKVIDGSMDMELPSKLRNRKDELGVYARLQTAMLDSIKKLLQDNKRRSDRILQQFKEMKAMKSTMEATFDQMDAIIASSDDAFFDYDIDEDSFDFSNEVCKLLDIHPGSQSFSRYEYLEKLPPVYASRFQEKWQALLSGESARNMIETPLSIDENLKFMRFSMFAYVDKRSGRKHIVTAVKDITLEVEQEREINRNLFQNPVTGLQNRQSLVRLIDSIIESYRNGFHIIVIDVDDFKYINSTFGYEVGNDLLVEISNQLELSQVPYMELAHLEGDRFAMIVHTDIDLNQLSEMLNQTLNRIRLKDNEFILSGCTGVATYTEGNNGQELLQNAEIALLKAKEKNLQGREVYSDVFKRKLGDRLVMMGHLKKAIELGELYMVYQPIVDSFHGHVVSYESLVRWKSPVYGFVAPNVFIDMAESTGYIIELGRFIYQQAISFAKDVADTNEDVTVSINISPKQLLEDSFSEKFIDTIKEAGVHPGNIAIEITESVYIDTMDKAIQVLSKLRDVGIKVYLDDFGTGYSSLNYLENLPIDYLKIDKSFVDKIGIEEQSKSMIPIFKSISENLQIDIIAEGVETQVQLEALQHFGCDLVQGYLFSKPLRIDEILNTNKEQAV